jgi:PEGA domain
MNQMLRICGFLLLAALSGCTLIVQGTTQAVTFTSNPEGATVSVAGQTGVTPVTLELPKDDYQVAFKRAGYEEHSVELRRKMSAWFIGSIAMGVVASTIDLATGAWKEFESTEVNVTLQPLPDTVQELPVSVSSQPPGADILIQNRSYGVTPKDLKLPWQPNEKEKEVTLRLDGYVDKSVALLRSEKQLGAALEPKPLAVTLKLGSKPDKAEVRIDGRLLPGKTPITTDLTWKLGDKPRTVEWTLDGYKPEKREITRDTKTLEVEFQEAVEEIILPLKIEPAGAKVVVDGKPLREGEKQVPLKWSLSTTKHVVVLSQPGYATKTVEVLRSGAAGPLVVRLAPALPGNQ